MVHITSLHIALCIFVPVFINSVSARKTLLRHSASRSLSNTDLQTSPSRERQDPGLFWQATQAAPPPVRNWENLKVLVFWCAKFEDRIVDLLIRNEARLRETGVQHDLLIGHYDQNKQLWINRNETWYRENVHRGVDAPGFKLHLLKTIRDQNLAGSDFNLADYDWVWMFDEDVDITYLSAYKLFRDAAESQALLVGPAFLQRDPALPTAFMAPYYPMNTPQWDKQYRYVPLVEIIMPMIRPQALDAFFDCANCIPPYNSDWGLDHVWCSTLEKMFQVDGRKTCAIVDHTGPIVHLNYGSTRKKLVSQSVKNTGKDAERWLKHFHWEDYRNNHFHKWISWEGYGEVQYQEDDDDGRYFPPVITDEQVQPVQPAEAQVLPADSASDSADSDSESQLEPAPPVDAASGDPAIETTAPADISEPPP